MDKENLDYTKAIEIDPNYVDAYNNRGVAKMGLEDYKRAISDFTKAIELDPNDAVAYSNRGISKQNLEQPYCSDYKKACELGDQDGCDWYKEDCR